MSSAVYWECHCVLWYNNQDFAIINHIVRACSRKAALAGLKARTIEHFVRSSNGVKDPFKITNEWASKLKHSIHFAIDSNGRFIKA